MKINIDNLSESDLIDLNNRIIQRLRMLSKMRSQKEMMQFNIGDRVTFQPEGHPAVVGMLTRFNSKTVTIITDEGEHWNVMPRFLHKCISSESTNNNNSNGDFRAPGYNQQVVRRRQLSRDPLGGANSRCLMRTNILQLIAITVLTVNIASAQGLYPLHHGDLWQFSIYDEGGLSGHFSVSILGDTVLQNGKNYVQCSGYFPAKFLRQEGPKVYAYSEYDSLEFVLFDFAASINDTISRFDSTFDSRCIVLHDRYYDSQYAQNVWIFEDLRGSMTLQRWTIADSLGVVQWSGELSPRYTLTGARIDGILRFGTILYVSKKEFPEPENFVLSQNYPNPFNPQTRINLSVGSSSNVSLVIVNVLGQEVVSLFRGYLPSGQYTFAWDASSMTSGIYFCRLEAGQFSNIKKLVLMK